jgi:hypothetical protein
LVFNTIQTPRPTNPFILKPGQRSSRVLLSLHGEGTFTPSQTLNLAAFARVSSLSLSSIPFNILGSRFPFIAMEVIPIAPRVSPQLDGPEPPLLEISRESASIALVVIAQSALSK